MFESSNNKFGAKQLKQLLYYKEKQVKHEEWQLRQIFYSLMYFLLEVKHISQELSSIKLKPYLHELH